MNHCGIQQSVFATCEDMNRDSVVCPKPRRLALLTTAINDPIRRWHLSYQAEICDSKSRTDLLDTILSKDDYGGGEQFLGHVASSPPYFCGSPPSRVSNPLIQDSRFRDAKVSPSSPLPPLMVPSCLSSPSPPSSRKGGGCVRGSFGNKPAMRIEGFDCLDRGNRRNCSIPTLA